MRSKFASENEERIAKIKTLKIESTTAEELREQEAWMLNMGQGENPWLVHLLRVGSQAQRYPDGRIEDQSIYFLGTGIETRSGSLSSHNYDIDCVLLFKDGILQRVLWNPPVKILRRPSGGFRFQLYDSYR
jgi:hypothetical protein